MTTRINTVHDQTHTIGLQDVLLFLRRGALLAILTGVVAGAAAYVLTRNASPVYQATVALLASSSSSGYSSLGLVTPPPVDAGVYQTAVLEGPVAREALTKVLGQAPSAGRLKAFDNSLHIDVQKQAISSVMRISVDSSDPKFAAAAANALSTSLINWDIDRARQTVARSISALQQSISDIDAQLKSGVANGQPLSADNKQALTALRQQRSQELSTALARSEASVMVGLLEPLSTASVPTEPVGPKVAFKSLIAFLLGLGLAYGLLFVRWTLDPRISGRGEIIALTGLPILAEFPTPARGSHRLSVEAASFLRSSLMTSAGDQRPLVLAITTPRSTEAKEGVSVSLAASLARAGYRTLLVDADLRHPSTTYGLDVSQVSTPPLEVYLESPYLDFAPVSVTIGGKHDFDFVPSFTAAQYPVELLNRGLWSRLEAWRGIYDFILVDCPPVLPFADTLTVAPMCSGVVLATNLVSTTRTELNESLALLRQNDVQLFGMVLTNVRATQRSRKEAGSDEERALRARGSRPLQDPQQGSHERPGQTALGPIAHTSPSAPETASPVVRSRASRLASVLALESPSHR